MLSDKERANQEVAERFASVENGKVSDGGITLKVAKIPETDELDEEVGGVKGEDQRNSILRLMGDGEGE